MNLASQKLCLLIRRTRFTWAKHDNSTSSQSLKLQTLQSSSAEFKPKIFKFILGFGRPPNYIRYVSRFDTDTSTSGNVRSDACDQYSDSDLDDTKDDDDGDDVTRFDGTFGASSF